MADRTVSYDARQEAGLAAATASANTGIEQKNAEITNANTNLAEGADPTPLIPLWTVETYFQSIAEGWANSYAQQMDQIEYETSLKKLASLSEADKAAALAILNKK